MNPVRTISGVVTDHATTRPEAIAFIEAASGRTLSWAEYDRRADAVAHEWAQEHEPGDRIALQFADSIDTHIAMVAAERAGLVGVGIGPRAGRAEVEHLVGRTGAVALVRELPPGTPGAAAPSERSLDDTELWFLNSTSGTTGLPKCVMHHQARWFAFHEMAVQAAALAPDDVWMSLLPAPFGFGLWTSHFTPTLLGNPCVVLDRFSPAGAVRAVEQYRVSAVAAVSTQFVMMLNTTEFSTCDVSSLRVLFTGGEMVPPDRAHEWEARSGSHVLQFYGSNETGALSCTTLVDSDDVRLHTAGHVIDKMHVRLFDPDTGADVTTSGGPGIAACRGPVTCLGYYDDDEANALLYTDDGWMRTGDLCTIDADGVLRVAGRASDFVIRGGKNLSAAVIEQECATMPGVLLAAAVAKPDPVFGERVCVFCAVAPDTEAFDLATLTAHLDKRGVGKEYWPEYLVLVPDDLPRSSGGKVAKSELRRRAADLPLVS